MAYKFGALISIRNEEPWIEYCLKMIWNHVDAISITRGLTSWTNNFTKLDGTMEIVERFFENREKSAYNKNIGLSTVANPQSDEAQRNYCLQHLKEAGCDFVWIVDPDEFYHENDIIALKKFCEENGPEKVGQIFVRALSFWHGMGHCCGIERFGPVIVALRPETKFHYIRNIDQDPGYTLPVNLYHMTAVKTQEAMKEKILGWSHSHEVVKDWWDKKWMGWLKDRKIRDLHPVSPGLWPYTTEIDKNELPKILHKHPWFKLDCVK